VTRQVLWNPIATRPPAAPYSPGLLVGSLIFLSGQTGVHPGTAELGGTIEAQTRQALENMNAVLGEGGASLANVVSATVFVTRREDIAGMNSVYREFFGEPFPARATVIVAGLGREQLLVEIQAIATTGA